MQQLATEYRREMKQAMRVGVVLVSVGAAVASATSPLPPYKPPPPRQHVELDITQPVDGLVVTADLITSYTWKIEVSNETDQPCSVLWDESSYVNRQGRSQGRLVPLTTRRMDLARPHPPSPIAPHATLTEGVVPEAMAEYADVRTESPGIYTGARLIVTLLLGDKRVTWQATVR